MSQAQTGQHWPFEDHEEEGKASMTGAERGWGGHWVGSQRDQRSWDQTIVRMGLLSEWEPGFV